jgi:hypothetical protein
VAVARLRDVVGAEFEVLGPPEFREHLRARVDRFGRAVG